MIDTKDRSITTLETTSENLEFLIKARGGVRVSLYVPIAVEPPESDKNPVNLRDMVSEAREGLLNNGMKEETADAFLQPFQERVANPQDLLTKAKTLAYFADQSDIYEVPLPQAVTKQCHVGNQFLIKPLIPFYDVKSRFLVICLDQGGIRTYQGNRWTVEEIEIPDLPRSIDAFTRFDDPEKSIQHHTADEGSTPGAPGASPTARMHGQGLPDDLEQSQKERFIRAVAKAVEHFLNRYPQPLVAFGVEKNIGLFQSLPDWSGHTLMTRQQDPQNWSAEELHSAAWELLQPTLNEKQNEQLDLLKAAYQKEEGLSEVGEIALAAATGRVELAGIAVDRSIPGICDVDNMKVRFIEEGNPICSQDLLDWIASETIRHGGTVVGLEKKDLPNDRVALATTRY